MAVYILPGFPVRCPRGGGTLQAPLMPSAQACPKTTRCAPRRSQREKKEKGKEIKETPVLPCSSSADAMKGGVGKNSGISSPALSSPVARGSSASASHSSSRSRRSRSSHSDTWLSASFSSRRGTGDSRVVYRYDLTTCESEGLDSRHPPLPAHLKWWRTYRHTWEFGGDHPFGGGGDEDA